ncbi:hypothetical protein AVEN_173667-1 [Araneus ventricosus]|uniref:Uncharacterized protein n=1 Tax=Araneus ventricosus TaxID=182803 RepID=A0A4Y2SU21_ARAVE|nr:hypothetical protein AVEN_100995-1 [Araneus ventricosus]GBN91084.1 hypothetical protein AVEN_173667-1 [Araneus ventricosus]
MRCSSLKELSSQRLASIPRDLRTPVQVQNLAPRSDFSIFSDLENRVPNQSPNQFSIDLLLSETPNYKLLRPASMRRGRKFKSQGFVGLLTATSNPLASFLSPLTIGRGSEL